MAIQLNVSNSLMVLADRMTEKIGGQRRDPFKSEWVVTQTEGMNTWLKQRFAGSLGISANIRFCSPDDIVSNIRYWLQPAGKKPLDRETMRWAIYEMLGDEKFRDLYPDKAAYFQGSDIRRISLADEMADLFDQYQVYRTDMLTEWNTRWTDGSLAAEWQEWLWHGIRQKFHDTHIDRVETKASVIGSVKDPGQQDIILRRIPELQVFGLAIITPYYLEVLYALSAFMEVNIYLVNPAPEKYWLDNVSERMMAAKRRRTGYALPPDDIEVPGNELLLNMGKLIRDSFTLLFNDQDIIDIYDPIEEIRPESGRLLRKIQYDIQNNLHAENRCSVASDDICDGSIVMNGCFTPLREVETLYNYLVDLVDGSADGISPREILVQVTDIDLYAPYIKAVFGNPVYPLPFSIADQTVTADNNIFTAIQALLSIDAEQMKAESVMELLESPYIRQRSGITDTEDLRNAVRQAGIIFSLDGRQEDDTRYISWNYGLKRILYGLCMSGAPDYHDGTDDFSPLDTAEGATAMEQRIRFINFLSNLNEMLESRKTSRSISDWAAYLRELLEQLVFAAGERDDDDHSAFIALLEEMSTLDESVSVKVDFEVFRHSFMHRLTLERRSQSFLGQGITFCSMVPMRSIPFRVVAMLGMDHDKFPRKDSGLSFSHIDVNDLRRGDRSIRNNDRHLFLETILSAKEILYISYLSRDEKNAEHRPPSSLVDELIDYVSKGMPDPLDTDELRKLWVSEHPLHGFSRKYFEPNAKLRNYLAEDRFKSGIQVSEGTEKVQEMDLGQIDIEKLISFLRNPPKTYLNRQLGVSYYDEEMLLADHENFEPGNIDRSNLQRALLKIEESELEGFAAQKSREGVAPLHNMGKATIQQLRDQMEMILSDHAAATQGKEAESYSIDLKLADHQLHGLIRNIFGGDLVEVCVSSDHFKYLLAGYVRYLALCASGHSGDFIFIAKAFPGLHRIPAGKFTPEMALEMLSDYVKYYVKGHKDYFKFYPNIARDNFKMIDKGYAEFSDALEKLIDDEKNFEFKDEYLLKAIDHGIFSEGHFDDLQMNVRKIMGPLKEALPVFFSTPKSQKKRKKEN